MALRTVIFNWSDEHGDCYDCGNPAAYRIVQDPAGITPSETALLRCSVCAAKDAADGERIVYLFDE